MNEFDEKAREWDKNKMHLERTMAVAAQLGKMVAFRPNMKALEFGAGTGLLSFYLKDRFSEITLMDSSMEMLKMAEGKMGQDDRLKFRTLYLNLEKEPYEGDPFDIIYSQMVLHHVGDTGAMIKKFFQILTPGGVLAIADLYPEDGSFHDGSAEVHHGFNPVALSGTLRQQGFDECRFEPCFTIRKEMAADFKEYPVFLLTASKR